MNAASQPDTAPWTLARLLSWTTSFLERQGVDDPRLASEVLLAHAAKCRRIDLYARFDQVLDAAALDQFREVVRRAGNHEPIAYLVGEKEFFSLRFCVTRDVLIPRAETEEVVEAVVDLCCAQNWEKPQLWDVGTGSGCLAIAVLTQVPSATCLASDVSAAALEVARQNARRHGVESRMVLAQARGLDIEPTAVPDAGFHLILCNPPYIPVSKMATLDRAVRDFEPRAALTDEADGLTLYRELAGGAAKLLASGGIVVVEIGDGCGEEVGRIMTAAGGLGHTLTRKDRTVGKERVMVFSKKESGR